MYEQTYNQAACHHYYSKM